MAATDRRTGLSIPLPPTDLRFMAESDDKFVATGAELAGLLYSNGVRDDDALLDVGCGYGRLATGLLSSTDFAGEYLGFDILPRHIRWCQQHITPIAPRFRFDLIDVRNDRYFPSGRLQAYNATFPAGDASQDACCLFSVFTHLYRADIARYLGEIARVLRPGGTAVTTWLLFDDSRLGTVTSPSSPYPLVHVLDEVTRYSDERDPLRAIAYELGFVTSMIADAGLELRSVQLGRWARGAGPTFQDLVVFTRPT